MKFFLLTLTVLTTTLGTIAQDQRTVLLDAFTNAHCGPCTSLYAALGSHIYQTERKDKVVIVYHHWRTYADDKLYQYNMEEPIARAILLGGVSGTPTLFIGGSRFTESWSGLGAVVDEAVQQPQEFTVTVNAMRVDDELVATISVARTSVDWPPVNIYAAVLENIQYKGRNGVVDHPNTFRRGLTGPSGSPLDLNPEGKSQITLTLPWDDAWVLSELSVVAAVQSPTGGETYEAAVVKVTVPASVIDNDAAWDQATRSALFAEVYTVNGQLVRTLSASTLVGATPESTLRGLGLRGAFIVALTADVNNISRLILVE